MRSASLSRSIREHPVADGVTPAEKTFRNAKLIAPSTLALVGYKIVADVAGKGALLVITMIAARRLTPRAFGVFGLGTTLGWMLAVVADFGIQLHVARAVARAPDLAGAILRRWWRVRVAASGAAILVVLIATSVARVSVDVAGPLVLLVAAYAATSLVEFLNYFYRGLSRSDIESTLTIWQRGSTLVLAVAVLVWRPGVTLLAAAILVPALATLAWSAAFAMRGRPVATVVPAPGGAFGRDVFPIGLGIVLSAIYFRIDVLLVEQWAGIEAVAGYNAVFRIIEALRLVPAAVLAVGLPALCTARTLRPLARVATGVTIAGILAAVVLRATAAQVVPLLFGSTYAFAIPACRVLALALPLLSLNYALTHQIVAWNRQHAYAAIAAVALLVNVALNAWLIPTRSITGAAWATVGTELWLTAGCAIALGLERRA